MTNNEITENIVRFIMQNHNMEVTEDFNDILNVYIRDIFQQIKISHGKNVTMEIIESEVDDYFDNMCSDKEDKGMFFKALSDDDNDEDGIMPDIHFELGCFEQDPFMSFNDDASDEINFNADNDLDSAYDILRNETYQILENADINPADKENIKRIIIKIFAYASYNIMILDETMQFIRNNICKDNQEFEEITKQISENITKNIMSLKEGQENEEEELKRKKIIDF